MPQALLWGTEVRRQPRFTSVGCFTALKTVTGLPISGWGHSTMPAVKQEEQLSRAGQKVSLQTFQNVSSLQCYHPHGNSQEQINLGLRLEEASRGLPTELQHVFAGTQMLMKNCMEPVYTQIKSLGSWYFCVNFYLRL